MSGQERPRAIAGFWARFFALLVDIIVLALVGLAIGYPLREQLVLLGPWGRLLGFVIAAAYFGIGNSSLTGGQTLGKRLLKLKVVDAAGAPLSVSRSFTRFMPLGAAWFLNGIALPSSALDAVLGEVLSVVVFGIGLSIGYLYLFNRRTRQSLQDLLVGSYVVKASAAFRRPDPPWRVHYAVCGLLLVASAAVPLVAATFMRAEPFVSMLDVYRVVISQPRVINARVMRGNSSTSSGRSSFLSVVVFSADDSIDDSDRARKLATTAFAAAAGSARSVDRVSLTMVYGFDIGLSSFWRSRSFTYTPNELIAPQAHSS